MKTTAQSVSIRAALFVGLAALSIPLALPLGMAVLVPLQGLLSPWPSGAAWHWLDDFVFDLPLKWPYLVLAPGIPIAIVLWTVIACAYGWLTRRLRLLYVGLGVLPTVWVIGIGLAIVTGS
jgi:hypothetical protein